MNEKDSHTTFKGKDHTEKMETTEEKTLSLNEAMLLEATKYLNKPEELAEELVRYNREKGDGKLTEERAMRLALANLEIVKKMRKEPVTFRFRKINGELREAEATLESDKLPETKGVGKKSSPAVQVFFDLVKGEWRSYRIETLILEGDNVPEDEDKDEEEKTEE